MSEYLLIERVVLSLTCVHCDCNCTAHHACKERCSMALTQLAYERVAAEAAAKRDAMALVFQEMQQREEDAEE